jgi:hypothetical protein
VWRGVLAALTLESSLKHFARGRWQVKPHAVSFPFSMNLAVNRNRPRHSRAEQVRGMTLATVFLAICCDALEHLYVRHRAVVHAQVLSHRRPCCFLIELGEFRMGAICIPERAKAILESVVEWLRSNDEAEIRWKATTKNVEFCVSEMRRTIGNPVQSAYNGYVPTPDPDVSVLEDSLSDVEGMLTAMRQRNRNRAMGAGIAAIAKLT